MDQDGWRYSLAYPYNDRKAFMTYLQKQMDADPKMRYNYRLVKGDIVMRVERFGEKYEVLALFRLRKLKMKKICAMVLHELEPGLYKIRINEENRLIKSDKINPQPTAHLLLIKGKGEKRTFQIDNQLSFSHANFEEGEIEIVKRLGELFIDLPTIHLTWRDEEGDTFTMKVYDAWGLRNLFEEREFLRVPFNYKPKRK